MTTVISVLIAILIFALLIFVHELGHFVAGIAVGVTVETFSIGYGKALVSKTIRGVKFQIGRIPLGGFCQFKGEDPKSGIEEKDSYMGAHPLKRIFIAFNGPFFNYLFAVVCFMIVVAMPSTRFAYDPVIDVYSDWKYVQEKPGETLAYAAGLRSGDRLIAVNDMPIETSADLDAYLADMEHLAKGETLSFSALRSTGVGTNMETIVASIPAEEVLKSKNGLGFSFTRAPRIERVQKGSPAEAAGLLAGDTILAVNGAAVLSSEPLRETIFNSPNAALTLSVLRDDARITIAITPEEKTAGKAPYGFIGVEFSRPLPVSETVVPGRTGLGVLSGAVGMSGQQIASYAKGIAMLFTNKLPLRESLGGPVRIVEMTATVASQFDPIVLLQFTALISLILFVMNLLPIPVVDGSLIVYALIELIARRPINRAVLGNIQTAGMAVLIVFAVAVTLNDIAQIFFR